MSLSRLDSGTVLPSAASSPQGCLAPPAVGAGLPAGGTLALGALHMAERYREVRQQTEQLCLPLGPEDCGIQSMADCSPTKWHLGHTSWFFETFVLKGALPGYRPFHPRYGHLFNSYYNSVGERHPRAQRGLLSRPPLHEVHGYRAHVDQQVLDFLAGAPWERLQEFLPVIEVGLHHEQQHQELLLTDIKHAFAQNPLRPAYREAALAAPAFLDDAPGPMRFVEIPGGLHPMGHPEGAGFAFDNEGPQHRVFVAGYRLGARLVSCGEYLEFMEAGGYRRPDLWLSDGWDWLQRERIEAPLYWEREGAGFCALTLGGVQTVREDEPVCHVSYYEADAFARWARARLPTEAEWEVPARGTPIEGNLLESGLLHPGPAHPLRGRPHRVPGREGHGLEPFLGQLFGDVWEWTQSPYVAYPGYRPPPGALGEYNGKFMCNQIVLRGGSCLTPRSHLRATYRNFFPPSARWQMTGIRLAKDL